MVSVSLFSGLCALLPAHGLPAMFLARLSAISLAEMKVLKTIRLRGGKAGACIRFALLDER
jgi:hypothetical protein